MKKTVILSLLSLVLASRMAFANYSLSFNDNSGTANAGSYTAGTSFSFDVYLTLSGTSSATGISYWLDTAAISKDYFTITSFTLNNSTFDTKNTTASTPYSFTFAESNGNYADVNNLGGTRDPGSALGAGTYLVGTITLSISNTAAAGTYSLATTTLTPKASFVNGPSPDFAKNFLTSTAYTVTILDPTPVPEPASVFAAGLTAVTLLGYSVRRRKGIARQV